MEQSKIIDTLDTYQSLVSHSVLAGEVLTKMILQAQKNGLFVDLSPDLVENGIAILQYADDTILCISHDPESLRMAMGRVWARYGQGRAIPYPYPYSSWV